MVIKHQLFSISLFVNKCKFLIAQQIQIILATEAREITANAFVDEIV
jgi:hypothetical protein